MIDKTTFFDYDKKAAVSVMESALFPSCKQGKQGRFSVFL